MTIYPHDDGFDASTPRSGFPAFGEEPTQSRRLGGRPPWVWFLISVVLSSPGVLTLLHSDLQVLRTLIG